MASLTVIQGPNYTMFLTPDWDHESPETPEVAQHLVSLVPRATTTFDGPVGIAWLRRTYAHMLGTWRYSAPSWGCGRQDAYGELMDEVVQEIRAAGFTGPLEVNA